MLCFSHVNATFQSFFKKFLIGLHRICLRGKVGNLVSSFYSLLAGIDCVTDKMKDTFSSMKNTLFCPQIWSREHCIFRALKFRPSPLLEKGTSGPLLIQSVTLSKPLAASIFIETPDNQLEKFGMPNL